MTGVVTLRRVVISVILAGCLVALVWAVSQTRNPPARPVYSDPAVRQLFPEPGDHVVRQERVGVTLASAYTGVLQVNGVEVPEDETERVAGLNQIFFTPGPDKAVESLGPDRNCIAVVLWRYDQTRDQSRRFAWCFYAH
jgi:hypothetical protein